MYYSHLFGKTSKTAPADVESVNAKLLTQGGFISKQMAGVYSYLPLGLRVLTKIQNIVREEMNAVGASEILMPALTQAESYKTTGRDAMDILFKMEIQGHGEVFLNPTHEEVVTPLVQGHTFSYRDLPVAVYQIQNKFRNEPRAKSGLLRGREFNMKDLYSFHANHEDLDVFYARMIEVYKKVYARLGIGDITLVTFASGGAFSRYSHEFQALCPIGEDTIYVCEKCQVAVNKEIIADQNSCPNCMNVDLVEKKAIEVGNIFKLGTRFSDAFGFSYQDADGQAKQVPMGCYGLGPSRLMGTLVELFHDEKGIVWPEAVAPFRVHLVALGPDQSVLDEAEKLYQTLLAQGIEVLFDNRLGVTAGEKFNDADLIGLPVRLLVSKKSLAAQSVEVKRRIEPVSSLVKMADVLSVL